MRFFVSRIWPTATSSSKRRFFRFGFFGWRKLWNLRRYFEQDFLVSLFIFGISILRGVVFWWPRVTCVKLGTSDFFLSGSDLFAAFLFSASTTKIGGSPLPLSPHSWRKWQLFGICLPIVSSLVQRKKCWQFRRWLNTTVDIRIYRWHACASSTWW